MSRKKILCWDASRKEWQEKEFAYMIGLMNDRLLFKDNGYEYHEYVDSDGYRYLLKRVVEG